MKTIVKISMLSLFIIAPLISSQQKREMIITKNEEGQTVIQYIYAAGSPLIYSETIIISDTEQIITKVDNAGRVETTRLNMQTQTSTSQPDNSFEIPMQHRATCQANLVGFEPFGSFNRIHQKLFGTK